MSKIAAFTLALLILAGAVPAEQRFPPPDFRSGYSVPFTQVPAPRAGVWQIIDVGALAVALGVGAYLVLKKRSRAGVFLLTVASLAYFGFWRKGCVCSIGSIQNVAAAGLGHGYALPWGVLVFFLLPLVTALFFGRIFCGGVCPLGAIQDIVLWKPTQLPGWVDAGLGLFAYAYLGLAVLYAAMGTDFVICRWDPFVGFFRLSGPAHLVLIGGALLVAGMFIGRIYCRFICPYGVLLRLVSRLSQYKVSITPRDCIDCRLCEQSCPFGAIHHPTRTRPSPPRPRDRVRLAALLLLMVILPIGMIFIGRAAGPRLARIDPAVIAAEELQKSPTRDDAALSTIQSAAGLELRYVAGGGWLGAWLGIVIAAKLLSYALPSRRSGYSADAGACLSCARCYKSCPVQVTVEQPIHRPVPSTASAEVAALA